MYFRIIAFTNNGLKEWNLTDAVTNIEYTQTLKSQAGKCVLTVDNLKEEIPLGSGVIVQADNKDMFRGRLFAEGLDDNLKSTLTFYDGLRYWQGNGSMAVKDTTISDFFVTLCRTLNVRYKSINSSWRKLPYKIFDNKSYFSMWQTMQEEQLVMGGDFFFVRDEYGTAVIRNAKTNFENTQEKIVISDYSATRGFNYERSIDKDTYNYVQLINENSETKKRETHTVFDQASINNWGRLHTVEKTSENSNTAQLKKRAEDILKAKNRITKILNVEIQGTTKTILLRAGDGVVLALSALSRSNMFGRGFIIETITHRFSGGTYTISLDLMLE